MHRLVSFRVWLLVAALAVCSSVARAAEEGKRLTDEVARFVAPVAEGWGSFSLSADIRVPIDGKPQDVTLRLERHNEQSFDLDIKHKEYWLTLRRRSDATAFALPYHQVVFLGRGEVDGEDHLAPKDICERLFSSGSLVSAYAPLLTPSDPVAAVPLLGGLLGVKYDADAKRWKAGKDVSFRFGENSTSLIVEAKDVSVTLRLAAASKPVAVDAWPNLKPVALERVELERQLARGIRRALEVLAPSPELTAPETRDQRVEHGWLRWIDGQRVVVLHGTPEQIGQAHGQLLRVEAQRCVDSVLYAFGTVQTIRTGRWFRHDLEAAYARLSRHIPEDHKRETRALAAALNISPQTAEVVNVFPEMFHCSGFAVFGKATADGKLYHGRVLDYMTTIGLQDASATMVIAVDGKIPFVTVGYGGFIGSVSGMNMQAISLGEMGGRGEGKWDGVPMATLMRRALEECTTLDQVMDLWKNNPRTCEYYYVFADGKTNRTVGVAAVPESIEFLAPGQSDPRLGDGIPDAVVLSAGSRLEKLRERVKQKYGKIDAETAQWLMSRPVAMNSNLHNVLFVPEDRVLYVANADHRRPAADCPYLRLDLRKLVEEIREATTVGGQ